MSVSRHHHYIPQFYLAGFTETGLKNCRISVVSIGQKKWWTSVKSAGAERDYNRIDIPGIAIDAAEKAFSIFENDVAAALRRTVLNRDFVSLSDMVYLLRFAALLLVRSTAMRDAISEAQEKALWLLLQQLVGQPERWEEHRARLRAQEYPILPDLTLEEAMTLIESGGFQYASPTSDHVFRELGSVDGVARMLYKRNWKLLRCGSGGFICSDRPVSCVWEVQMPPGMMGPGLMEPNSEVAIPLSRHLALVGAFGGPTGVGEASEELVADINARTVSTANRFLYSAKEDFVCEGTSGKKQTAAAFFAEGASRKTISRGSHLVFVSGAERVWLEVAAYKISHLTPFRHRVDFWTDKADQVWRLSRKGPIEYVLYMSGEGDSGKLSGLRFDKVSWSPSIPCVLKTE
ncbi:MAG: DUF4238 domain-containing protein [Bacteroidota bacterium]